MSISLIFTFLFVFATVCDAKRTTPPVLHGLFYNNTDENHLFYGFLDLDIQTFNLVNTLNIDDVGNPKHRKYSVLPMTYDPNEDVVYLAATSNTNQVILSVLNGTTGVLLHSFRSISTPIVSLQYDIFQKQLFAHLETNVTDSTQIVEIDPTNGEVKRVLATIANGQATDISSYCPICRKYFFMVYQNQTYFYVGVDSTDAGGISWQTPINIKPMSMKFDYKTFTMYTTYINETDQMTSMLGILNRTIGTIGQVVGKISDDSNIFVTKLAAFDIAEKMYYASNVVSWPYSLGVSYVNVNTTETKSVSLSAAKYSPYAWFVKQFIH